MLAASHLLGKSSEVMFDLAPEYAEPEAFLYAAKHCSQLWASWRHASKQSPSTPDSTSHEASVGTRVGVRLEYFCVVLGFNVGKAVGDAVVGILVGTAVGPPLQKMPLTRLKPTPYTKVGVLKYEQKNPVEASLHCA